MHFCFIVEEQYRRDSMPLVNARQLLRWGHTVDVLEPSKTVTSLCDLTGQCCDAYVLKTVSDGPGLSILQAAEAVGIPTINNSRAIRLVRDKTIFTAFAHAHGLPVPRSYFIVHPRLLKDIPRNEYPLVVKPTNGSSGRGIYRVNSPAELATLNIDGPSLCFFLAQQYVENPGYDIKLYAIGEDAVHPVAQDVRQAPALLTTFSEERHRGQEPVAREREFHHCPHIGGYVRHAQLHDALDPTTFLRHREFRKFLPCTDRVDRVAHGFLLRSSGLTYPSPPRPVVGAAVRPSRRQSNQRPSNRPPADRGFFVGQSRFEVWKAAAKPAALTNVVLAGCARPQSLLVGGARSRARSTRPARTGLPSM